MLRREARFPHSVFTGKGGKRASFAFGTAVFFPEMPAKVAIIVSKKVAKRAVDRTKIKRRIAHAVRPFMNRLERSVAFYPNSAVLRAPFFDIRRALEEVLPTR